jgi:protein-disulfide isomerase
LGTESDLAGQAAECAKDQGKFWLFHDALYNLEGTDAKENNGNLTRTALITLAANTGLDATPFANCLDSKKYEPRVKSDTAAAQSAGVNSTPTIFVNSQKLAGALPFAQFQAIIEAELKK